MYKLAVFVSGGGTNLQSIIDAVANKRLNCQIVAVVADRDCFGLERGKIAKIPTFLVNRKEHLLQLSQEIDKLLPEDCDLIVLAGFLSILNHDFIAKWQNKIINIHPSLLPKHGGAGMWGLRVHQSVIAARDSESGCSVHYVDGGIDSGGVIAQSHLQLLANETAESLQKRVIQLEHNLLVDVIEQLSRGKIF